MEDDFETIMLLRDLLTSGEGHSEGNPRQTVMKLLAAAESLNINLTENFDIENYTMNFTDFWLRQELKKALCPFRSPPSAY